MIVVPAGVLEPGLGPVPSFYGDIYIRAGSGSFAGASGLLSLTLDSWSPQGPHRAMFTMAGTGDLILPVPEPANEALIGLALLAVIGFRAPVFARLGMRKADLYRFLNQSTR
jgi:hypothetical protein